MATFLLIPGAGTDPRIYDATIHALRRLGHDGLAPPLPVGDPDVDPDVARAAERFDGAPGPGMFTERWPHQSWPDVPTRILCPREDRLFPWEFQKRVAGDRLGLALDEIGGGHLPMLSRPAELAQCLVQLSPEQPS